MSFAWIVLILFLPRLYLLYSYFSFSIHIRNSFVVYNTYRFFSGGAFVVAFNVCHFGCGVPYWQRWWCVAVALKEKKNTKDSIIRKRFFHRWQLARIFQVCAKQQIEKRDIVNSCVRVVHVIFPKQMKIKKLREKREKIETNKKLKNEMQLWQTHKT